MAILYKVETIYMF